MNPITSLILALTILPIVFGALLGLLRGSRRSLLRLILVVVSLVLAFALCGVVANAMLDVDVSQQVGAESPMTLADVLMTYVPAELPQSVSNIALVVVQSIFKIIVFLLLFLVFRFLTWAIAYPLCKLFVKPKTVRYSDGSVKKKKRRLLGTAIGLIQGVVVAVSVCVVLTGLSIQAGNIVAIAGDLDTIISQEQTTMLLSDGEDQEVTPEVPDEDDSDSDNTEGEQPSENLFEGLDEMGAILSEFADSKLGKFYNDIGAKPFDWLSEVKNHDGKQVTLSGQLGAVRGVVDIVKELMNFKNINFTDLFAEGNVDAIRDIFNALDNINSHLSKEARDTIKDVLTDLGNELDLPVNMTEVDFNEIDFAKEGEIFTELLEYRNSETIDPEEVEGILENILESDMILDVLGSQDDVDLGSQLRANNNDEYIEVIEDKIAEMESGGNYDQDKIDALKHIFGLA